MSLIDGMLIKPCIWCGQERFLERVRVKVFFCDSESNDFLPFLPYAVRCSYCHVIGPAWESWYRAVTNWNQWLPARGSEECGPPPGFMASPWINVADHLPETGVTVEVWLPGGERPCLGMLFEGDGGCSTYPRYWRVATIKRTYIVSTDEKRPGVPTVTHWRYLPDPAFPIVPEPPRCEHVCHKTSIPRGAYAHMGTWKFCPMCGEELPPEE